MTVLKSGLRRQYVYDKGEKCYFSGLNEGLVQYLDGEKIIKAFLTDDDNEFKREVDEKLGYKWLIEISKRVDGKLATVREFCLQNK